MAQKSFLTLLFCCFFSLLSWGQKKMPQQSSSYEKAMRAQQKAEEADRKINKAFGIKPKPQPRNPYARNYTRFNPAPKNNKEVRSNINARISEIMGGKSSKTKKPASDGFKIGRSSGY